MTQQAGTLDTAAKITDLEEENELLLLQLHQVQEELEVYFLKCKALESGKGFGVNATTEGQINWVDDELPEALAEVERLKSLVTVQAEIKDTENRNALNVKLGNMLLEGSNSLGGISKIPFAILGFWRNATSKKIPAELGGKEFTGVIKAYEDRGFVGVKSILKDEGLSPIVKANAYTALARHLMRRDAKAAAEAASKAFEIDPKPYRLKWLAFKLHDAGELGKAEAMLDLLPESTTFSDSEAKQVRRIRYEAKNQRQRDARQKTQIVSKQQQVQKQLSDLKVQLEALSKEKAALVQERSDLQQDKASLMVSRDDQEKLAEERLNQINALTAEKDRLAQARDEAVKKSNEFKTQVEALSKNKLENTQKLEEADYRNKAFKEENELVLLQLHQVQEELEVLYLEKQGIATSLKDLEVKLEEAERDRVSLTENIQSLELELKELESATKSEKFVRGLLEHEQVKNVALVIARDEQAKLAVDRLNQINTLMAEKGELSQGKDEAVKQSNELKSQVEELSKDKVALSEERSTLQQERTSLTAARDELSKLASERQSQLATFNAEKAQLTQARDQASQKIVELQGQLEAAGKERAALVQERSELQQEKMSLSAARDEQSKLAAERQSQLATLNAEKAQLTQARDQANEMIVELKGQLEAAGKERAALVQERSDLQQEKMSLSAARDEQSKLAAERQSQLATLNAEKAQLTQARDEQAKMGSQMDLLRAFASELEIHINNKLLINAQNIKDSEARICSKLEKSILNNTKQIEAFVSLQSYLGSNSLLADFHGWPISPDIGLFLLKRIIENKYDLIIEFGSGTSTALLARGLEVKDQQDKSKILKNSDPATSTDIPSTAIVSFEHDTRYHAKTLQLLKAQGLDGRVRLVHAPLVDWHDGENTYLYYDCLTNLTELAQQYVDRQVRILMLVDGPPGATCPNARYPAVPFVFKVLGRHHIDVVLDDASRPEEKQVIELWKSFWKQRSFRFTEFSIPSEKGIYLATPHD